jgi:hypothetical protein
MKRTNEQIFKAIERMKKNAEGNKEKYYTALMNYWLKYNLNQEQCEILEQAKKEIL